MINYKYKFIFVHLPKTGGQSIRQVLNQVENDSSLPRMIGHAHVSEYLKMLGPDKFNSYFKFGVIRNPWDRVVSHYFFWRGRDLNDGRKRTAENVKGIEFCKTHSFREYVLAYDTISTLGTSAQYFNVEKKFTLDYVIRFEKLQAGFNEACYMTGIDRIMLPIANPAVLRSKGTHYSRYYDEETAAIIGEIHKMDLEQFGYTFGED